MIKTKSKLYNLTREDFRLPHHITPTRKVVTKSAENIPILHWPDGRWCISANMYMLKLYEKGLSRKDGGGTLLTYATYISPLIRFCFKNKIDFIELTDNQFSFFIKTLVGERSSRNPETKARDANAVIDIGRRCLDFLESVGRFYHDERFICPSGDGRISAEMKEIKIKYGGHHKGKEVVKQVWYHRSFPTPDPLNKRLPVSTTNLKKLRDAVLPCSSNIFQRKRRYVMLKLLEITGGRRSEVSAITVDSVLQAAAMDEPALKLITRKLPGGKEEFRYVPIAKHDVTVLVQFLNVNRARIIRNNGGHTNDCGYVLVSETTGKKLKPNTITQEISILCKFAGIREKTCPQMFRHRYITKLFVALIEQHKIENPDTFRKLLLDTETFKQKVQQCIGHRNLDSLDVYINLAFEEVANFKKTYSIVRVSLIIDSFRASLHQICNELQGDMSPYDAKFLLEKLIDDLDDDLERLRQYGEELTGEDDPVAPSKEN